MSLYNKTTTSRPLIVNTFTLFNFSRRYSTNKTITIHYIQLLLWCYTRKILQWARSMTPLNELRNSVACNWIVLHVDVFATGCEQLRNELLPIMTSSNSKRYAERIVVMHFIRRTFENHDWSLQSWLHAQCQMQEPCCTTTCSDMDKAVATD